MGKRGRKPKTTQANVDIATVPQAIDAIPTSDEKVHGTDKITKYFPTSPKPHSSKLTEDIPGMLTPETTPTKNITKTPSSSSYKDSSPSPSSIQSSKTTESKPTTETRLKQTAKTDSPEHKRSAPVGIVASKEKTKTRLSYDEKRDNDDVLDKTKEKPSEEQTDAKVKPKSSRKSRKSRKSKQPNSVPTHTKTLKDYFPARRSNRRCKSEIEAEQMKDIEEAILSVREDGLKVTDILGKGRGVVSTKPFRQGDFVVEYYGDLISIKEAKQRETDYAKDPSIGCYMYYFQFKNKQYCIDATMESGRLGRLLNHSSKSGNCCTKKVEVKGQPHLIIVAARDITEGEELLYDYGDRDKESLQAHPWLAL